MFVSLEKASSYSGPSLGMSCFLNMLNITIPGQVAFFKSFFFFCLFLMLMGRIQLWIEDITYAAVITDEQITKTRQNTFF